MLYRAYRRRAGNKNGFQQQKATFDIYFFGGEGGGGLNQVNLCQSAEIKEDIKSTSKACLMINCTLSNRCFLFPSQIPFNFSDEKKL